MCWQLLGQPLGLGGDLLDGGRFDQASLGGHVVLVDFWATWCAPCVAELPAVNALLAEFGDRGLKVIGVSLDDDKQCLANFVAEQRLTWPIICDPPLPGGGGMPCPTNWCEDRPDDDPSQQGGARLAIRNTRGGLCRGDPSDLGTNSVFRPGGDGTRSQTVGHLRLRLSGRYMTNS